MTTSKGTNLRVRVPDDVLARLDALRPLGYSRALGTQLALAQWLDQMDVLQSNAPGRGPGRWGKRGNPGVPGPKPLQLVAPVEQSAEGQGRHVGLAESEPAPQGVNANVMNQGEGAEPAEDGPGSSPAPPRGCSHPDVARLPWGSVCRACGARLS